MIRIIGLIALALTSVSAISCSCGIVAPQRDVLSSVNQEILSEVCFTAGNTIEPFCSTGRFLRTNIAAISNSCINTYVGTRGLPCTGYFLVPDIDGITYDAWLCSMINLQDGSSQVSFQQCSPEQKQKGQVYDLVAVQALPFDPLWSSSSRCRDAQCPEAMVRPVGFDPYITNRTGQGFSVCNRVQSTQNFCDSSTGQCTCQVFLDGTSAYTGQACQFEKGQGFCCANPVTQIQSECCAASTPPGDCQTRSGTNMCGVVGESRSDFCQSADGITQPTCQKQEYDPDDMQMNLISQCVNGYACPNDPALIMFNPMSSCRTNPANTNCSCQCSLCTLPCSGGNTAVLFGQCGYTPPTPPGCQCFVPATTCVPVTGDSTSCSDLVPCIAGDLCGGPQCTLRMNDCHTPTMCDNSALWIPSQLHPCICGGNGYCDPTTRQCLCLNFFRNLNYTQSPPLYDVKTQCVELDPCSHCNQNPFFSPVPSTCQTSQPNTFNCTCIPYWYTSGSFQNTEQILPSYPVFQCSTGTCVGYFSIRDISTVAEALPYERLYIDVTVDPPICRCPPGSTNFDALGRQYCRALAFVNPNTGIECGHGNVEFLQQTAMPGIFVTGNLGVVTEGDMPLYTNVSLGGTPLCTCDGFFNETWPKSSWYAPLGTWCQTWCIPSTVTFFLEQTPGTMPRRKCIGCDLIGYATIVYPNGETQCGGTICQNGGVWDQSNGRCNCVQYPFDINWPTDLYCNISMCGNFTFNSTTFECNCPNDFIFDFREPPPGCDINNPQNCIDGPQTAVGCQSKCTHGIPNPLDNYDSCVCDSTLWVPPLCTTTDCDPTHGLFDPMIPFCTCYPTWTGGNCGTNTCNLDTCEQTMSICQRAGAGASLRCVCKVTIVDSNTYPYASTDADCTPSYCNYYQTGALAGTVARINDVIWFGFEPNVPGETQHGPEPTGNIIANAPAPSWVCGCSEGFDLSDTRILPNNRGVGTVFLTPVCNRRQCFANQDVALSIVPGSQPICRCRCPSLLYEEGPYNLSASVSPLSNDVYCPIANVNQGAFLTSSLSNPCPGFIINDTYHKDWIPQCILGWKGINCTEPLCTGNQRYTGAPVCSCQNAWTPAPYCNVCPLLPRNPFTNYTSCSCLDPANYQNIDNNCTFVPCDFLTDGSCIPPPIIVPPDIPTLGSLDGDVSVAFIIAMVIVGILILIIGGVGIAYGVIYCRKQQLDARRKEAEKLNKKMQDQSSETSKLLTPDDPSRTINSTPLPSSSSSSNVPSTSIPISPLDSSKLLAPTAVPSSHIRRNNNEYRGNYPAGNSNY